MTTNNFKVLGVNDDKDFCECCGKRGLKAVVWIENTASGEIRHFGTTCATKPAKGFNLDNEIKGAKQDWKSKNQWLCRQANQLFRAFGGKFVSDGPFTWKASNVDLWNAAFNMVKAA